MLRISSEDPFFGSYLEIAAVRRSVVDVWFWKEDSWKKIFIRHLQEGEDELVIHTLGGQEFPVSSIKEIEVAYGPEDLDSISCLCS